MGATEEDVVYQEMIVLYIGFNKFHPYNKSQVLLTQMDFFNSAVDCLETLVCALGAGLGIWGAINLLEGYGNDNPGSNAHVR